MKSRDIAMLQAALGYLFQRTELLQQALTHSSQARELEALQTVGGPRVEDNEQLEFLGDAVLGFVTTEELFNRFPSFREGELSKLRAHLVSEKHLINVAQELELGHYLSLGRGEEKSGGRNKTALLVDALEAVLAAIYMDGGLEAARRFVLRSIVAGDGLQIGITGKIAGQRKTPAILCAGEGARPGTQQDVHGRSAIATSGYQRQSRVRGPGRWFHKEECGAGCRPPGA